MMTSGWSKSSDDPDPAVMIQIQIEWWSRSCGNVPWWSRSSPVMMIQIQWWCAMMIQIEWWSRSSSMTIQIERWSRSRWLEDEDDLKMKMNWIWRWSSWYREEDQCWKSCRKNTFLVKRECWCICNFGMYSSMYLMYCNLMFILGCFYYVFDSCCHAPMFLLGGSIM